MVLTTKYRWWLLGGTLALTLTAAGFLEGNDSSTVAVIESGKAKSTSATSEKPGGTKQQSESAPDIKLGKLQRQPIKLAEGRAILTCAQRTWVSTTLRCLANTRV